MNSLPTYFFVFNKEGIFRVAQSFSQVSNFEQVTAQLAAGRPTVFHRAFQARGNPVHLFSLRQDTGFAIALFEPFPLQTHYALMKNDGESSIVPAFHSDYLDDVDFQVDLGICEHIIDPHILAERGIDTYLIWVPSTGVFLVWKIAEQIYIPPLPNIHDLGNVCLGSGNGDFNLAPTTQEKAEKLLDTFYASQWNRDLISEEIVEGAQKFFRWPPEGEHRHMKSIASMSTRELIKDLRVVSSQPIVDLFGAGL
jgi:hypothetical protein